jgi:hypothetical protein
MPSNENGMATQDPNPGFSPRQLEELDKRFDERGFNQRQLAELDQRLDCRFEAFEQKLDQKLDQKFKAFRLEMQADMDHVLKLALEQWDTRLRIATEPTAGLPARVQALESTDLPARVERLEAAVFPPRKPARVARRRRG